MDSNALQEENCLMTRMQLILLLVFGANLTFAQQLPTSTTNAQVAVLPQGSLPYDPAKVAESIRGSYYHPDDLAGLDCSVSVDWTTLFSAMKATVPADRMKVLQGLKIRSHAMRGKVPELTFDWSGGPLDTKDQVEGGFKQMASGFYQMYWSLIASPVVSKASDFTRIEPLPNGELNVVSTSPNMNVVVTLDKEFTPTHYVLDGTAMKGTFDLHYVVPPNPVPGDLRRISSMLVSEQIGTSNFNVDVELDYQPAGKFNVPQHVTFSLIGAYSVKMDFEDCSALDEPKAPK